MGVPKLPPAKAQETGRREGKDSGGRDINFGPEMGTPDELEKPFWLSGEAELLWDALLLELKGSGVLRSVDATALSACCETYSRWREALRLRQTHGVTRTNRFGEEVRAPWIGIEAEAAKQLQSWLREFGLTPSAVAGLMGGPKPDQDQDDPFDWSSES